MGEKGVSQIYLPESLVAILSERKDRTKLGLGKYAAEPAERGSGERWRFASVAQRTGAV